MCLKHILDVIPRLPSIGGHLAKSTRLRNHEAANHQVVREAVNSEHDQPLEASWVVGFSVLKMGQFWVNCDISYLN